VVSFHWGTEGKTELRDYQITLARAAIDAGASVVLGHHPHILQAVERYRQGAILYSLGNFVFGSYSRIATRSMISLITFRDRQLREIRLIPINVNNPDVVFQPKPLSGQDAVEAMAQVQQLSLTRGTDLEYRDDSAILTLGEERGN
jgi:poly-gamma-glutamate synthesis protein (capsule biosynthesis protein)